MSGSDIRDILELGKRVEGESQKKTKLAAEKRPSNYNREIYSLTGGITPASFIQPTYKAKLNIKKKAKPWISQPFTNPARHDDLELRHWVKASEANQQGYPFARFDEQASILQYTEEEYEKHLKVATWTKDETDYLMNLCKRYELRFQVIADRYQFDTHHLRSIDDLKERYFNMQSILQGLRGISTTTPSLYDKTKELERKHALGILFDRSKESQEEEADLLVEIKRIEQNRAKLAKERENLMELLQQHDMSMIPLNTREKNTKEKKRKRQASHEQKKEIEEPVAKLSPGVYVRSQRLPMVKPSLQAKVAKVLNELSIGTRPMMPTTNVCDKYEKLQNSIVTLFELKKVVDKMEMEHRIKLLKE